MKTIIIFQFMVKDLKLKGLELLIYALIYSFTQYGQKCFMSAESIADAVGCSRSQVFRVLKTLHTAHFIDYDDGYICRLNDADYPEISKDLEEQIRIAKTPWLY